MSNLELKVLGAVVVLIPIWGIASLANLNVRGSQLQQRQAKVAPNWTPYQSRSAVKAEIGPPVATPSAPQPSPEAQLPTTSATSSDTACQAQQPISTAVAAAQTYIPREGLALADPSNYGERYTKDVSGRPVRNQWLVVLHETVDSAASAVNFFRTPHPNDLDQASYHTLITRDGTVVYVVPPEKRAYGAGNSVFVGANGPETVKTDPNLPPSVNNFAYHISLETPPDGANNRPGHSGYTDAQYRSLAWIVAKTRVPEARIVTHQQVDRSGERVDPRSFDSQKILTSLSQFKQAAVALACTGPAAQGE